MKLNDVIYDVTDTAIILVGLVGTPSTLQKLVQLRSLGKKARGAKPPPLCWTISNKLAVINLLSPKGTMLGLEALARASLP